MMTTDLPATDDALVTLMAEVSVVIPGDVTVIDARRILEAVRIHAPRYGDARAIAAEKSWVELLERGMRHIGDNPDRSRYLDQQAWRDEAQAALSATYHVEVPRPTQTGGE